MLTQKQISMKERLVNHFKEKYENTFDLIDVESLVDSNISFEENKRIIQEEFDKIEDTSLKEQYQAYKEMELQMKAEAISKVDEDFKFWKDEVLPKAKVIIILGLTRAGKTSLSYKILEQSEKPVYILKHPNPADLVRAGLNYKVMYSIEELTRIQDSTIYVDEPQLLLPSEEKRLNLALLRLLSLAGQRGLTLVFSTSDSRWVQRSLESYCDVWVIKDTEFSTLKQGSMAKKIIKENVVITPDEFMLPENEYIFYCRKTPHLNGKKTFVKPVYFDEKLSKPYRSFENCAKTPQEIAHESKELTFIGILKSANKRNSGVEA